MTSVIAIFPPLGRVTVARPGETHVNFYVIIEIRDDEAVELDVDVWHNQRGIDHWSALNLKACKDGFINTIGAQAGCAGRKLLTGSLCIQQALSFTVRWRGQSLDWKWIRHLTGVDDGIIIPNPETDALPELGRFLSISSDLKDDVKEITSEAPETRLWRLTVAAPARAQDAGRSQDATAPTKCRKLGYPKSYIRFFSLQRLNPSWLGPQHGNRIEHANWLKDALMYSFLGDDGHHLVILAISGVGDVQTVLKAEGCDLIMSIRNDSVEDQSAIVLVASAKSFDAGLAAAIYEARKLLSPYRIDQGSSALWRQSWLDGLGYCTWNALGRELTELGLLECLTTLRNHEVNISNLIIDDNWQALDERRCWRRFEANERFPEGLKRTVFKIREQNPRINTIGVWHALFGYWNGISPNGEIVQAYATRKVDIEPSWTTSRTGMTVIAPSEISTAFKDFYGFLSSSGINCVKCDVQSAPDTLVRPSDRRDIMHEYITASKIAYLSYFGSRAVACMSQAPTNLFLSHLLANGPEIPMRNSDDYFPDEGSSHTWHIWCNAHNTLLMKYFNVVPDWDMFQTKHPWGWFHAAARAISGGPVYITDRPGEHDMEILNALTAETPRGDTIVLRPSVFGRSLTTYDPRGEGLVKLGAYNGDSHNGSATTALFNITSHSMTEIVHVARDFLGTGTGAAEYVVNSYRHGAVLDAASATSSHAIFATTVEGHEWDILTANPVHGLSYQSSFNYPCTIRFSNLGLLNKLSGAAAILYTHASLDNPRNHARFAVTFKALGTWGVWMDKGNVDIDSEVLVLLEGKAVPRRCVSVGRGAYGGFRAEHDAQHGKGSFVRADLVSAFHDLGFKDGYSNEVEAEMFVSLDKGELVECRATSGGPDEISNDWVNVD